jgi:MFS family permease
LRSGALAPFRQPAFRAIWTANLVSNFGSLIQSVGAAWLMTVISGSPQLVALVQASATIPIMLLSLFAGAIADSYDRRLVMLFAQTLMLVASAILAALDYAGYVAPWNLLFFTFLVGIGTSLNGPAWQASLRAQVPIQDLPAAIALNSIGFNLARSVGPAIGGALMAVWGASANFTVNALSYIGLIVVLLRWRPALDPPKREPLGRAIRAGIAFAIADRGVRRALIRSGIFGMLTAGLWSLMPLVARDLLHGNQSTYGIILGAFGTGSIGGAFFATTTRRILSNDHVFGIATLGFAAGAIGAATVPSTFWAIPFLLVAGASWVTALSTINIVVQMSAPPVVVGRCLALYQMCAFGGLAVGAYGWGGVAEFIGVQATLIVSASLLAGSTLLGIVLPLPQVDHGAGDKVE